jgi:hypothetical protein
MTGLTSLQKQVLEMLLNGDDEVLAILREQAKHGSVTSNKETGVGFYAEFVVPSEKQRTPGCQTFRLTDVHGTAAGVNHGLGFVLFVNDGALAGLEGYTYDEPWPNEIRELKLTYWEGSSRNMDSLKKLIRKQLRGPATE